VAVHLARPQREFGSPRSSGSGGGMGSPPPSSNTKASHSSRATCELGAARHICRVYRSGVAQCEASAAAASPTLVSVNSVQNRARAATWNSTSHTSWHPPPTASRKVTCAACVLGSRSREKKGPLSVTAYRILISSASTGSSSSSSLSGHTVRRWAADVTNTGRPPPCCHV